MAYFYVWDFHHDWGGFGITSVDSGYQGLTEVTLINRLGQLCAGSITDGLI